MISSTSNLLLAQYNSLQANSEKANSQTANSQTANSQAGSGTSGAADSAATITLSEAAQARLNQMSLNQSSLDDSAATTIAEDARASMTKLLADSGKSSPLKDGQLNLDLSRFDREELYAIAANADGDFPADQQKAAQLELQRRFDVTMAGGLAVVGMTGDVTELYDLAREFLNAAGPEEQASEAWQKQMAAVNEALAQLSANPDRMPGGIANDPVDDYLIRAANGEAIIELGFSDVAKDARAALDKQRAAAEAAGKPLVFDFSALGSRGLSAISLNQDGLFSRSEVRAARDEMSSRVGRTVQEALRSAGAANDPTAFSKNLISQYQTMSVEEREAAGFTPEYFLNLQRNYESSQAISQLFAGFSGTSESGSSFSLLNFL
jgi:ribosomal protein S12 methylthiotransferase accessory factor YcaO